MPQVGLMEENEIVWGGKALDDYIISSSNAPTLGCNVDENIFLIGSGQNVFAIHTELHDSNESKTVANQRDKRPLKVNKSYQLNCVPENICGDIQSISYSSKSNTIAISDEFGHVYIFSLAPVDSGTEETDDSPSFKRARIETTEPIKNECMGMTYQATFWNERATQFCSSWSGIQFSPANENILATVHQSTRTMQIFDIETHNVARSFELWEGANNLQWFDNNIAVLEGNQLSIWDPRDESKGCIVREQLFIGSSQLFCLSPCYTQGVNALVVAGESNIIYSFDPRTWKVHQRFRTPAKQNIISLLPSQKPGLLYLVGTDNEIVHCDLNSGARAVAAVFEGDEGPLSEEVENRVKATTQVGFRGDSRWVGIGLNRNETSGDGIFGFCDVGSMFVISHAERMPAISID